VFSITAASVLYVSLTSERRKKGTVTSLVEYIVVGCNQKRSLAGIRHVAPLQAKAYGTR
jgi:hypothetical protein